MDIPSGLIDSTWLWLSWLALAAILLHALYNAPWKRMSERDSTNIYFGTIVTLLLFWNLKAGIMPGQTFHFLGACMMTLMFGWSFAMLAISALVLFSTFYGNGAWDTYALNTLLLGSIPISITWLLLRLAQTRLPHNFFIYIFLNTFFAAAIGIILTGCTSYGLLWLSGAYTAAELESNFLPLVIMLAFPEGTLNGIVITMMVVYKPEWMATFYDKLYLVENKRK
jgi:uncharacterized membrane protein